MNQKSLKRIFVITWLLTAMFTMEVLAKNKSLTIDETNIKNGIATITYSGKLDKKIMLKVDLTGKGSYQYQITNNSPTNIPLQMGNGTYTFYLLEHATGDQYALVQKKDIKATITNSNGMFVVSNPIVNLSSGTKAIAHYSGKLNKESGTLPKVTSLYDDVITYYKYDFDKMNAMEAGYVPVMDDMYADKLGICYDYAVLMAGVLRSQQLPTRLLMGYIPEIEQYHAWNQVLIDSKWVYIDTTYDAAFAQAGQKTQMIKPGDGFKILKIY